MVGTKGLLRSQNTKFFHDSYAIGKDVRNANGSLFTYSTRVDEIKTYPEYGYLNRVLTLCLNTDICTKLGLSVADFMHLDLATFNYIEEQYHKLKAETSKTANKVLRDLNITDDLKDHVS